MLFFLWLPRYQVFHLKTSHSVGRAKMLAVGSILIGYGIGGRRGSRHGARLGCGGLAKTQLFNIYFYRLPLFVVNTMAWSPVERAQALELYFSSRSYGSVRLALRQKWGCLHVSSRRTPTAWVHNFRNRGSPVTHRPRPVSTAPASTCCFASRPPQCKGFPGGTEKQDRASRSTIHRVLR